MKKLILFSILLFCAVNLSAAGSAINVLSFGSVPTGTILAFSTTTAPTGYLYCNGAAVSTTTYSDLYSVIGFKYGNPGSGNMNLPDLRGMFVRGVDDSAGRDPDSLRVIGSTQTDTTQGHIHTYNNRQQQCNINGGYSTAPIWIYDATANTSNPADDGTNGTPRTANETRPENVAVAYIIKY